MKKALITGITGQDGSYLAELLLSKGYEVHGMKRRASSFNTSRIDHLYQDVHETSHFKLHYGDLSDSSNLIRLVHDIEPDEIYNLAAQSHVKVSWDCPEYTADCDALGTLRLLEAMDIEYRVLSDDFEKDLDYLTSLAKKDNKPVALVIRKGTFSSYRPTNNTKVAMGDLLREEALEVILKQIGDDMVVPLSNFKDFSALFSSCRNNHIIANLF